ncbi:MAG: hypothetical protein R3B06_25175 [Kofleriaceae bacterium]
MTDAATTLRAWLDERAAADPDRRRFGAASHRYQLAPPLDPVALAALAAATDAPLPAAYRRFVATVGSAGAGPYHGLWPAAASCARGVVGGRFVPDAAQPYRGVIGLGHVGCGQVAVLAVAGAHAGSVWLDARACGRGVVQLAADFDGYYLGWVAALSRNELPPGAGGTCPLPRALSMYLGRIEAQAGAAPGTLAPQAIRAAFEALPDGAIRCEASGDDPFFAEGAVLALCPTCELTVERLAAMGLRRAHLATPDAWEVG